MKLFVPKSRKNNPDQEKESDKPDEVQMLMYSIYLFIALMFFSQSPGKLIQGLDLTICRDLLDVKNQQDWWSDIFIASLAPHRMHLPKPEEEFYFFHRTQTSFSDFVGFLEGQKELKEAQME